MTKSPMTCPEHSKKRPPNTFVMSLDYISNDLTISDLSFRNDPTISDLTFCSVITIVVTLQ